MKSDCIFIDYCGEIMKAAILTGFNKPLFIGDITIQELTFGQVLFGIMSTVICESRPGETDGKKRS
jgi:D-arabinose 1-dehydrogenase-like Zn-dependent alcohol dehydrogenase